MRLYHGTNVEFEQIDLTKSNRFKDFGQGFYLTDIGNRRQSWPKNELSVMAVRSLYRNMSLTKTS